MSRSLFIPDLNLVPRRPQHTAALRDFCETKLHAGYKLYILGDLFEVWLGGEPCSPLITERVTGISKGSAVSGNEVVNETISFIKVDGGNEASIWPMNIQIFITAYTGVSCVTAFADVFYEKDFLIAHWSVSIQGW